MYVHKYHYFLYNFYMPLYTLTYSIEKAYIDVLYSVSVPANVLMKGFFCEKNLNDTFHVGVRQRTQKLILHKILNKYPYISIMNKGLSIVHIIHV